MMSVHFLDLINPGNPILYNAVCDHLNPLDLIHLLTTCKLLYRLKPLLWSINRSLRRFLKNPESFRSIMAKHNAIISGSHALQFLSRKEWPDSDLDVYVDGTVGIKSFGEYLTTQEGYVFSPYEFQSSHQNDAVDKREIEWRNYILGKMEEPDTDFDDVSSEMGIYCLSQIDGVFNFVKASDKTVRIQLILPKIAPLNAILGDYYSTYIFNFITWNRSYSLFPYHTFGSDKPVGFETQCLSGKGAAGVRKYEARGYVNMDYGEIHKCIENCPLRPHRRVGDKFCWVMDLDTEGVDSSEISVPQDVLETSTWGMKMHNSYWDKDENIRRFHAIVFVRIVYDWDRSGCFKYQRIYDTLTEPYEKFLEQMKTTFGEFASYSVPFHGERSKDWREPGEYWMDQEFAGWNAFWERSLMPNANIWKWQFPMLGPPLSSGFQKMDETD